MHTQKLKAGTFMGDIRKVRSLKGFTLSKTDHSRHMKVPAHEHEHPYISLLLDGVYQEETVVTAHEVKAGNALFRPKGFEHKNEIGHTDSLCFNLEIEKQGQEVNHYSRRADYVRFDRYNLEIMKIYFGFQCDYSDELLAIMVEESLHSLFNQQFVKRSATRALWVDKIRKQVRMHPEQMYSIDEVAESLHLHPNYFVRKFKEKTGCTFGHFLLRQRISKALDLMNHPNKSLTDIANESGFYDQSHFIRHFKRVFGTSPSRYLAVVKG